MSRFQIIEAEQRSDAWFQARAGRVTGSRAADILAKLKSGGEPASRRDYRVQLAVERLIGKPQESGYINAEMQWGIDHEPEALAAYETNSGNLVRRTGFLTMSEYLVGCSLDGDIDDMNGIVETKCPKSATHVGYLKAGVIPTDYLPQLKHNMWVSGAKWADFVSFDPRLPEGLQYFCVRLERDEKALADYEKELARFLAEVAVEVEELKKLRGAA